MKLYSFFMILDFKLQIALVKINKGLKLRFWNQEGILADITNKSLHKELKIIRNTNIVAKSPQQNAWERGH